VAFVRQGVEGEFDGRILRQEGDANDAVGGWNGEIDWRKRLGFVCGHDRLILLLESQ